MALGHHEMTDEERRVVQNTLLNRALQRVGALLKRVTPRVAHLDADAYDVEAPHRIERAGSWDLRPMVSVLMHSFGESSARFMMSQ